MNFISLFQTDTRVDGQTSDRPIDRQTNRRETERERQRYLNTVIPSITKIIASQESSKLKEFEVKYISLNKLLN